jgi:DNA-directed RNA polymerase subunit RPC12/RpoP
MTTEPVPSASPGPASADDVSRRLEPVPRCLLRTRRALCPTCGATLELPAAGARVECSYCGEESVVERRLRTVEVELVAGTDPAFVARPPAPFVPAHALSKGGRTVGQCPNCASPVEGGGGVLDGPSEGPLREFGHGHFECPYCGTRSKVEARLAPDHGDRFDLARFGADLVSFQGRDAATREEELLAAHRAAALADAPRHWDEVMDHRVRRMLTARDGAELLAAVKGFEPWSTLNPWRELAFVHLLWLASRLAGRDTMASAAQRLVDHVVARTAAAAWKYDERRRAYVRGIVRAAGRALFAQGTAPAVLDALAFAQPAAMLKLLLEVAEWALAHGDAALADGALAAAASSLDFRRGQYHVWRDKVDRDQVGEVLMYRLLYLSPPLLAWALDQLPRWRVADPLRAARFMDDCVAERPELVPLLFDAGITRPAPASSVAEYAQHLVGLQELESDAARAYLLHVRTLDSDGADIGDLAELELVVDVLTRLCGPESIRECTTERGVRGGVEGNEGVDALDAPRPPSPIAREAAFELGCVLAALVRQAPERVEGVLSRCGGSLPLQARAALRARAPEGTRLIAITRQELLAALDSADMAGRELHVVTGHVTPELVPVVSAAKVHGFAADVARHRDDGRRDFEATRVDDELAEARRDLARTVAAARSGGGYAPADTPRYLAECAANSAWLSYRARLDPRFKPLLATYELALAALAE